MPETPEIPSWRLFWVQPETWREAHETLDILFTKYAHNLKGLMEAAEEAGKKIQTVSTLFDRFCPEVCPKCEAVCCLTASVEYDFKDLLWLHALRLPLPSGQVRGREGESCRYLEPAGCLLPRISRPFICTWYLCPALKNTLEMPGWSSNADPVRLLQEVKQARIFMEEEFIRVTAG